MLSRIEHLMELLSPKLVKLSLVFVGDNDNLFFMAVRAGLIGENSWSRERVDLGVHCFLSLIVNYY